MEIYRVELSPEANRDLDDIFDYILLDDPYAAENMMDKIFTALQQLETFPRSGVKIESKLIKHYVFRMLIIKPYVAFYRVIDEKVYVYRILHGSSDYLMILKDIK